MSIIRELTSYYVSILLYLHLMQFGFVKSIISLILICSYSLGFAHNLIPHCNSVHGYEEHDEVITHHSHSHHFHDDDSSQNRDHNHLVHEDHFDNNYFDYLACLLEEFHHSDNSCNIDHYTYTAESKVYIDKVLKSTDLQSSLNYISFIIPESSGKPYANYLIFGISNPGIAQYPDRGPPITCL